MSHPGGNSLLVLRVLNFKIDECTWVTGHFFDIYTLVSTGYDIHRSHCSKEGNYGHICTCCRCSKSSTWIKPAIKKARKHPLMYPDFDIDNAKSCVIGQKISAWWNWQVIKLYYMYTCIQQGVPSTEATAMKRATINIYALVAGVASQVHKRILVNIRQSFIFPIKLIWLGINQV